MEVNEVHLTTVTLATSLKMRCWFVLQGGGTSRAQPVGPLEEDEEERCPQPACLLPGARAPPARACALPTWSADGRHAE